MAERQLQPYQFSISNANLAPWQAVLWGAEQHRQYAEAIGADGIEWMPIRSRMRVEAELGKSSMAGLVTSLHASFRTATIGDIVLGHEAPKELAFTTVMSRLEDPNPLLTMQHRVGRKMPVVVYPNEQQVNLGTRRPPKERRVDYGVWQPLFRSLRFQPTAELLHNWRVLSADGEVAMDGMKAVMARRNLDAVCFDTHHWTSERQGKVMPAWASALPSIVRDGTMQEMHICPARPDVGGDDRQLRLILDGRIEATEIGDMITCVGENMPSSSNVDVVLELPYAATNGDIGVPRAVLGAIRQQFDAVSS